MDSELENAKHGNAGAVSIVENGSAGDPAAVKQLKKASKPPTDDFVDPAKLRREKIQKLKARLQQEISRNTTASRKERNGQLFAWGAMVEAVYRSGNAHEREELRQWAKQKLTDPRHLKRAENGFARVEDEAENRVNA